jgi:hypothetical protein
VDEVGMLVGVGLVDVGAADALVEGVDAGDVG